MLEGEGIEEGCGGSLERGGIRGGGGREGPDRRPREEEIRVLVAKEKRASPERVHLSPFLSPAKSKSKIEDRRDRKSKREATRLRGKGARATGEEK